MQDRWTQAERFGMWNHNPVHGIVAYCPRNNGDLAAFAKFFQRPSLDTATAVLNNGTDLLQLQSNSFANVLDSGSTLYRSARSWLWSTKEEASTSAGNTPRKRPGKPPLPSPWDHEPSLETKY